MKLSIVVVSFNTKELLRKCLESIFRVEEWKTRLLASRRSGPARQGGRVEVIVVDNGSIDSSVEEIKNEKLKMKNDNVKFKIILNKENSGFARANNQGIKIAKGEYILLLNSDTEINHGTLSNLIEFARNHPEAGVIGARLLNPDGTIQPSVYHFPSVWRAIAEYWLGQKGTYEKYALTASDAVRIEAVTGAAMLIPRKTIEKIGLLDERYFMYFEDLDYCQRVKRAGFQVYYLPTAEIIHHHGASGAEIPTQTRQWLIRSSKIYNGIIKYWLLTFIIWLGQKWQQLLPRRF
ncbi:MAG: glycosyltransferase family 2 protein [Patescibacteria group bacterium]